MHIFEAGKGINATKINENFTEVINVANDNETALLQIANTALLKNGANVTQDMVTKFQQEEPILITGEEASGDIILTDNRTHFLSLTGNGKIVLPTVPTDEYSHTITLVVSSTEYTLDISYDGKAEILATNTELIEPNPFNVLYVFNKIEHKWNYYITQ